MMRTIADVVLALLACAALFVVLIGATGAALGIFLGTLVWTVESMAGPIAPAAGGATAWRALAVLAVVLAADVAAAWSRGRRARSTEITKDGRSA